MSLHPEQERVPPEAKGIPIETWLFRQPLCTKAELNAWIKKRNPDATFTPPPKPDSGQGELF